MTLVLVHGVPETEAIWDDVLGVLGRDDVVTLSPPGFGAPVPEGFVATSDGYRDWLVGELERLSGPIDLLGHDWGGGHVIRAATARPDLVRSVATDVAGIFDPDYVWHDMARVWQTPGDGEAAVDAMSAMPGDDRVANLVAAGMSEPAARASVASDGDVMGACILALYRSAMSPTLPVWGEQMRELDRRPTVAALVPTDDPYTGGPDLAARVAERWGAHVIRLDGLGHWWMMQDPEAGAAAIRAFLDRSAG